MKRLLSIALAVISLSGRSAAADAINVAESQKPIELEKVTVTASRLDLSPDPSVDYVMPKVQIVYEYLGHCLLYTSDRTRKDSTGGRRLKSDETYDPLCTSKRSKTNSPESNATVESPFATRSWPSLFLVLSSSPRRSISLLARDKDTV